MEGQIEKNQKDSKRVAAACLLCHSTDTQSYFESELHRFYQCNSCGTPFRDPATFLDAAAERARYLEHNNDVKDPRYQAFVSPIVEKVKASIASSEAILDYGCGTGPVIAKMLSDCGYEVACYDPFFAPDEALLKQSYAAIVCCEVIEHFHHPLLEFKKLYRLLKKGGLLVCMTDLWESNLDFNRWYYKDDPTHVLFYHPKNLNWIVKHTPFKRISIEGRLLLFEA